jgi:hypothetical protein
MMAAERIIKGNGCVVHMFLNAGKYESFTLRKGNNVISPQFRSLYDLCCWIVIHHEDVFRSVELCP